MQLTLANQEDHEIDLASNKLSVAGKSRRINEDTMQIESEIAQHLVDESDLNFVKIPLLNHYSDHISQLGEPL